MDYGCKLYSSLQQSKFSLKLGLRPNLGLLDFCLRLFAYCNLTSPNDKINNGSVKLARLLMAHTEDSTDKAKHPDPVRLSKNINQHTDTQSMRTFTKKHRLVCVSGAISWISMIIIIQLWVMQSEIRQINCSPGHTALVSNAYLCILSSVIMTRAAANE